MLSWFVGDPASSYVAELQRRLLLRPPQTSSLKEEQEEELLDVNKALPVLMILLLWFSGLYRRSDLQLLRKFSSSVVFPSFWWRRRADRPPSASSFGRRSRSPISTSFL